MKHAKFTPLDKLKHHVTGAIERGEATAIEAVMITKHTVTEQIESLIELFNDQFMKPQIHTGLVVSQIENEFGEMRFAERGDENLASDETITDTIKNACLCRLSASGYMDCTEWELCRDENEILEWLTNETEQL